MATLTAGVAMAPASPDVAPLLAPALASDAPPLLAPELVPLLAPEPTPDVAPLLTPELVSLFDPELVPLLGEPLSLVAPDPAPDVAPLLAPELVPLLAPEPTPDAAPLLASLLEPAQAGRRGTASSAKVHKRIGRTFMEQDGFAMLIPAPGKVEMPIKRPKCSFGRALTCECIASHKYRATLASRQGDVHIAKLGLIFNRRLTSSAAQ
jgi:hypothetical protein